MELETIANANSTDGEALISVKMALKCKQLNNIDRAKKLFARALTLSPDNYYVFLHYGEFLEYIKDFIHADYFYVKALLLKPNNIRVLTNRKRTLPVVNQLDYETFKRIDLKKNVFIKLNQNNSILNQLKKDLYFQYIYHTVALEGNTMSLTETQWVLETKIVPNKSVLEHNEIIGVAIALRFVNETLATNNNIQMSDILEIHKRVMQHVDPINAGTFRKIQVYVGKYTPPVASEVERLMKEFMEMLKLHIVRKMHPIHIAAFVHYKLVEIHPFIDGNGRTARILMNLIFLKYDFPPVIIKKEEQSQYIKFLEMAYKGDDRPFYRFIAQSTERTIDTYLNAQKSKQSKVKPFDSTHDIKVSIPLCY